MHADPLPVPDQPGDVLSSPQVVDPRGCIEIVMPTGGAAGVLVTTTERAAALRHAPVPRAKRA